jgi:hypothetical protein
MTTTGQSQVVVEEGEGVVEGESVVEVVVGSSVLLGSGDEFETGGSENRPKSNERGSRWPASTLRGFAGTITGFSTNSGRVSRDGMKSRWKPPGIPLKPRGIKRSLRIERTVNNNVSSHNVRITKVCDRLWMQGLWKKRFSKRNRGVNCKARA